MKKYTLFIICTLLTGLLFTTCEPWIVPEAVFVNFNANGGQGDMKALRFMDGEKQSLTKNTYTRNGYIFDGWNTRSDGRGQSYTDRQNVTITKSVTLYAQWTKIYKVHFNANGGTGTMATQTFEAGVSQAIKANTFTRSGYIFTGWNTNADGSGTSYTDKQSITLSQNITLYAQWKKDIVNYTLTFNANGGTGTMAAQTFEAGVSQAIAANAFTRSGYTFTGWNTAANGSGTSYTDKQSITLSQNITLYAQWKKDIVNYTLTFDANGGSGTMAAQTFEAGVSQAIAANAFTRSGYTFTGWNTKADGSGNSYTDGQEIALSQDITLYAQWKKDIVNYTITFNANGGSGTMAAQTFEAGVSQAIKANTFTRSGYTFTGWNTNADGSGTSYTDKQSITISQNITLYAQWKSAGGATSGTENGYEWVDLGLSSGTKWATCNVGATSPEGYGDYFAWGETAPKANYDWSTYKYCNGSYSTLTKYNTNSSYGMVDNKTTLDLTDDAARVNWGGKWRIPTRTEQEELINNCSWTWTTQKGVNGYIVTSKINGNSIFLPAAGSHWQGTSVANVGSMGFYWSNLLFYEYDHQDDAYCLYVDSSSEGSRTYSRRSGLPIRAVFSDNDKPSTFVTLTFNANGGTGTMAAQTFEAGVSQAIKANIFTRSGYTFTGWNTNADGSGTSYTDKQSITISQNITLYAQWKKVIVNYTVTFNANGGTGTMAAQTFEAGVSQAIKANTFTRSGYTFTGWNTNADGSGTSYTDGQEITLSQDITLYAQWKKDIVNYTITFNANGGSGTMAAQTFEAGVSQAIAANTFTRDGYVFNGWNTKADGSGKSYSDKQSITLTQDITLYAQWYQEQVVSGTENGHDYVDLGLPSGLKWATCNVGATKPDGYGDYFAWGEIAPKTDYDWSTYKHSEGANMVLTKYNTESLAGTVDNKTTLERSDDAAHVNWGGKWRMPTQAEQEELINNCTWTWTTQNGVNGCKVTSKSNGNSIFLPAAGYKEGTILRYARSIGYYWSRSLRDCDFAYCLHLGSDKSEGGERIHGYTVRAVFSDTDFVTLSFNANGGTGTMSAQTFEAGVSQAIAANTFTRDGYIFAGWNTAADGSGTSYKNVQVITLTQNMTLYAQWFTPTYVDLGLSVKWATCNVGATSPEGYGYYFAWGETEPKPSYDSSVYKYCNGSIFSTLTKYNTKSDYGTVDNKTTLELSDDAARANWGGKWRMPTIAEQDELRNNCIWTWTTHNGVNGHKVTSKTNGNSIFLPAAAYRSGTSVSDYVGSYGYYWSSSLLESNPSRACYLGFSSGKVDWGDRYRYHGLPVRAVCP